MPKIEQFAYNEYGFVQVWQLEDVQPRTKAEW
jgi:hypothetical protein